MSSSWQTAAMERRLSKRHAAERRFRALGLAAIIISLLFLAFLLFTMAKNGLGGLDWSFLTGSDSTDPATAGRFAYVGFKGGSEPGVITLNYLVRSKTGQWFAITGNWHDPATAVSASDFAALMNRALRLVPH